MKIFVLTTDLEGGRDVLQFPTLALAEESLFATIRAQVGDDPKLPPLESQNWSDAWEYAFDICDHAYIDELDVPGALSIEDTQTMLAEERDKATRRISSLCMEALLEGAGAICIMDEQISQMRGMFSDEDNAIQNAVDDGENALKILRKARERIGVPAQPSRVVFGVRGGIVPAGECPECQALAYLVDNPHDKIKSEVPPLNAEGYVVIYETRNPNNTENDGWDETFWETFITPAEAARVFRDGYTKDEAKNPRLAAICGPIDNYAEKPASHWDVNPDHPLEDWKYEIANDDTRLGYSDWVAHRIESEDQS